MADQLTPKQEAAKAFDDAVAAGHFTDKEGDINWAGHYMYMGTDSKGTRQFKHMDTRQYSNWKPQEEEPLPF